jgi:hypothetical protein
MQQQQQVAGLGNAPAGILVGGRRRSLECINAAEQCTHPVANAALNSHGLITSAAVANRLLRLPHLQSSIVVQIEAMPPRHVS